MLTPEQQAQYNALLLKQYKGNLADEERAIMEALQLLRDAPEAPTSSADIAGLAPSLARMSGELDQLDADLGEMAGKVGGRRARAEAIAELGERDASRMKQSDDDAH
ncbi:MAG: hypothetical protein CFK52_03840 [Chloracidobacterium sp. CP2_5A]|nr:MAG: hypothetical protein CFK52_03840 [Chloracidobacterium sp. CP2_5A]